MAVAGRPGRDSRIITRRKRCGGGRATGTAGRKDSRRGRRGWRPRWGDAYFKRPRRAGCAVEGCSGPQGYRMR
jgi:hypothetical protein